MQFELTRTTAKFGVFNPREEKNKGNAFDLPFSVTLGADILVMLAPTTDVGVGLHRVSETALRSCFGSTSAAC